MALLHIFQVFKGGGGATLAQRAVWQYDAPAPFRFSLLPGPLERRFVAGAAQLSSSGTAPAHELEDPGSLLLSAEDERALVVEVVELEAALCEGDVTVVTAKVRLLRIL
jgi:hypothetical protein